MRQLRLIVLSFIVALSNQSFSKTLKPTDNQTASLSGDKPFSGLYVRSKAEIYFLGKQYLWKWNPTIDQLTRIKVGSTARGSDIHVIDNTMWLVADQRLLKHDLKINSQSYFSLPDNLPVRHLISGGAYEIFLGSANQMFRFDLQKNLILKYSEDRLARKRMAYFGGNFWHFIGNRLVSESLTPDNTFKKKKLSRCSGQRFIQKDPFSLWVGCNQKIKRYGKNLRIGQSISIAPGDNLVGMATDDLRQGFLFESGRLEVFDPKNKSISAYKLPIGEVYELKLMGELLVGLNQNGPFAELLKNPYHHRLHTQTP